MSHPRKRLELSPALLLRAYSAGVFPMADSAEADTVFWVDPKFRGVLPLDRFHVSRSLRKTVRRAPFDIKIDYAYPAVLDGCSDRGSTWINAEIRSLYLQLYDLGHAHSIEAWVGEELVGGLYGVQIGAAFFGESMFSRAADASKVTLVHLIARLRTGGFRLLDTQFVTEHLATFGAVEVPRTRYHAMLEGSVSNRADFWALPRKASPHDVLQASGQIS